MASEASREQAYSAWVESRLPEVERLRREHYEWRQRREALRIPKSYKLGGFALGLVLAFALGSPHVLLITACLPFVYEWRRMRRAGAGPPDIARELFGEALRVLDPGLEYDEFPAPDPRGIDRTGLFPEKFNTVRLRAGVAGRHGETDYRFRRVTLLQIGERPKNSVASPPEKVVFAGVLFDAAAPKEFRGTVHVLPDSQESKLGDFGRLLQSLGRDRPGELIRLECPEFERRFKVYASDPVEARYLLSTRFMETLVRVSELYSADLRLSFVDGRLWLAYESARPFFEVPHVSQLERHHFDRWVSDLVTITGHVDDLDLDQRIWSRAA